MTTIGKKISVILPCHNEEGAIGLCIKEIKKVLSDRDFEIIVSDSSYDNSPSIARSLGAMVISHNKIGYGNAYLEALPQTLGDYLILVDADHTYDFKNIPTLLKELDEGSDLAIGSRLRGSIEKGSMPPLHRFLGTPILNFLMRILFGLRISDTQSGFRAIKRDALLKLNLQAPGMEFASEMLIKAKKAGLNIIEVPVNYRRRIGQSKLKSFNDGWKHLRFMLLYSPDYLFLAPGLFLFIISFILSTIFLFPPVNVFGFKFITHPMFITGLLTIIGYQLILLGIFAKSYAFNYLKEDSKLIRKINYYFNLEKAIAFGTLFFLVGLVLFLVIAINWLASGFGEIASPNQSIYSMILMIIGIQTIFSAFFISILGIKYQ